MTAYSIPKAGQPEESHRRRAHALRAKGLTLRAIGDLLGVSRTTVMTLIGGQLKGEPSLMPIAANDNIQTVKVAHNGGCSTQSGMVDVSLARSAGGERVAA